MRAPAEMVMHFLNAVRTIIQNINLDAILGPPASAVRRCAAVASIVGFSVSPCNSLVKIALEFQPSRASSRAVQIHFFLRTFICRFTCKFSSNLLAFDFLICSLPKDWAYEFAHSVHEPDWNARLAECPDRF